MLSISESILRATRWLLAVLVLPVAALALAQDRPLDRQQTQFFENRVRPILVTKCYQCHASTLAEPEGGLTLDSKKGWMKGGNRGPAIVPGDVDQSRLIEAVRYENVDLQMPPDDKLSAQQIADLVHWVEMGAPDPRLEPAAAPVGRIEAFDLEKRRREHWSWQPLARTPPVVVDDGHWPRGVIDQYIVGRLEQEGLSPASPADRRTWIRRVTFDLIGLPPTPDEINAFLSDGSPGAFERIVDRLLGSPHFGEHWGQHWLDLVRFAETRGHEQDFEIPEAYRYRDYVIQGINEDVPYDQWVMEHVAGDLMPHPRLHPVDRTNQSIQGTGFWHLGEATHSPVDIRGDEADRVHNQIDVFSRTFLGLSMGCARCHDHKFDAISTRDYYALFGYLQSSSFQLADVSDPVKQKEVVHELTALRREFEPKIIGTVVKLKRHQLRRLPDYLVAAARVLSPANAAESDVAETPPGGPTSPVQVDPDRIQTVSQIQHLDHATLNYTVEHLFEALHDTQDPLHLFADISLQPGECSAATVVQAKQRLAAQLAQLEESSGQARANLKVVKSTKAGERNYTEHQRAWTDNDLIEDFSQTGPERWLTSGMRFGSAAAPPGDVLLGSRPDRPIERFQETFVAESDALSSRLTGLLRTRTFEITGDTIWYRFRGNADAFLAVDSHRVVAGPLHGVVNLKLKGDGRRWKWQSQYVRDYIGHRVHVEFTPQEAFALDRIQFAASEPPDAVEIHPSLWQLAGTHADTVDSFATLAAEVRNVLMGPIERLGRGELSQQDTVLLNWMLDHDKLFEPVPRIQQPLEEQFNTFARRKSAIENEIPSPARALALLDGSGEDEPVHIRGNHRSLSRDLVPRAILTALGGATQPCPRYGSGRLDLASRLVNQTDPLLPRVMVNRVWHHLFGRGIVPTVDDFGAMGEPPSHPELLDYLSRRFIAQGWSVKALIREIVLSNTYRMSGHPEPSQEAIDPTNRLLHRMPVRRLPAESIRDHVLAVSGRLDRAMFGPSVMVHITPFMRGNRSPGKSGPLDGNGRRSIYTEVRRNHLSAMLVAFDKPVPFTALGRRTVSNSPAQPLILLNDPFIHQQAEEWARRLLRDPDPSDEHRIGNAFLSAFARPPTPKELDAASSFLEKQSQQYRADNDSAATEKAWADLCHTLMNVKEFIYID